MIFTSIYGVVDGLFVSNYVGKTAFAAVNLIMPFLMAISALGFMIGTGGSAIVAKTLGEGKKKQANEYFSMLVYLSLIHILTHPHVPKKVSDKSGNTTPYHHTRKPRYPFPA